jgi:hypothetical protein
MRGRARADGGAGPVVRVCPLSDAGAYLQLLRPRSDLLCRRLCAGGPISRPACRRSALPDEPPRAPGPCGTGPSLARPAKQRDASGFTTVGGRAAHRSPSLRPDRWVGVLERRFAQPARARRPPRRRSSVDTTLISMPASRCRRAKWRRRPKAASSGPSATCSGEDHHQEGRVLDSRRGFDPATPRSGELAISP